MNKAFWIIVAIDAALFLLLFIATLFQSGPSDGGREMAIGFGVIFPGIVIGLAVLLYVFSGAPLWRTIALIVAAGPGLLLAGIQVRNGYLNYLIAQNASGRGYFQGQALKNMGQAVVSRDVAGLQRSAAKANVNAVGDDGMTLLRLAVMEADSAQSDSKSFPPELPVVRTLITLGANPDSGLETATKLRDPEILRVLLEAGADPNLKVSSSPVAFMWINIMPATNLRLLAEHGVDLNAVDQSGTPLVFCAAESENWEAVVFLIEQGAYVGRPDRTGRKLTDLIDDRLSNHTRFGTDPSPGLLRVKALLNPRQHG